MRGLAGRLWLAAAAALLLDVAKGDSVLFNALEFDGGHMPTNVLAGTAERSGVYQATPTVNILQTFSWKTAPGVKISQIKLSIQDPFTNKTRSLGESMVEDPTESSATSNPQPKQKRQVFQGDRNPPQEEIRNPIPLKVTTTPAGGNVTIDLSKAIHGARYLYLEVIWLSTTEGRSFSPAFAVLDSSNIADFNAALNAAGLLPGLYRNTPFLAEEQRRTDLDSGTNDDTPSGTTDTTPGPTLVSAPMPTASDSKSTGGLTTPAVAGIGAGIGVLGLLLIAFAIWYFLRKKKQQRQRDDSTLGGGGVSRSRTDELMAAEKEATLAAPAAAAPYSDASASTAAAAAHHRSSMSGGGGAAAPLIAPVAAAEAVSPADGGPPGYTPYTDRPASGTGTAGTEPAVVSREYAHLVEEGMTEEEIRRLEEEERALDAAIEQAVRRPTG